MKSIIQTKKECYFTHTTHNLHKHHIYGGKNRQISEKHGFYVYLSPEYHTGDMGVHKDETALMVFKTLCQEEFEKTHSREEFVSIIGRSYL